MSPTAEPIVREFVRLLANVREGRRGEVVAVPPDRAEELVAGRLADVPVIHRDDAP